MSGVREYGDFYKFQMTKEKELVNGTRKGWAD